MAILKPRVLIADDLQKGAYLKRRAAAGKDLYTQRKDPYGKFYEVEERDGPNVVLRDVMVPARQCIGSNHTIPTSVRRVCQEFELVIPREDVWATRMNEIIKEPDRC